MAYRIAGGAIVCLALGIGVNEYIKTSLVSEAVCHKGYKFPTVFMATKTPYLYPKVKPENNCEKDDLDWQEITKKEKCDPTQIWMMVRHGARNPSAEVIRRRQKILPPLRDEIVKRFEDGQSQLCEKQVEDLKSWSADDVDVANEKHLVPQGAVELKGISRRFQDRFPTLFGKQFSNDTYKFRYTKTQRAEASAKAFAQEIFGQEGSNSVWYPEPLDADPVLRFYKACPKWKEGVDKNPETYKERKRFEASEIFQESLSSISRRLGLTRNLTLDDMEILHLTCSFETSWHPETVSPWCAVFDKSDLDLFAYRQDLEYYWVDGYGYEITYRQACPPIRDFMGYFDRKINTPSTTPNVIAYFTHSGTTLKLLSRLGLFEDADRLLSENYKTTSQKRKWRTSQIDTFATNFAFVLFKCAHDEYHVGLFFQELPVVLPECGGEWLCPIEKLHAAYDEMINHCDVASMCKK